MTDDLLKDRYHQFVEAVMNEKITEYPLSQKINIQNQQKELKLKISYPDKDENGCKLYQVFIVDKQTNETYMSFYSKEKNLFMWYITNIPVVLL